MQKGRLKIVEIDSKTPTMVDIRDSSVVEWSPGGIAVELPVRDILVWPEDKFAEPEITNIKVI